MAEKVNDKIFWKDFHQEKTILNGAFRLVAMAGWVKMSAKNQFKSDQFRIVARTPGGVDVGWVNFEMKGDKLEALDLSIQPEHRRKGIATLMYEFARELGNDIAPSSRQTGMGKEFWSKTDHATGKKQPKEETVAKNQARERDDSDFI